MLAGTLAIALGIVAITRIPILPDLPITLIALPLLIPLLFAQYRSARLFGCLLLGLAWGTLRGHEMLARLLPAQLEGTDLAVRLCIEGLPEQRHDARGERWRLRARILDPLPGASGALAQWQGRRVDLSWYGRGEFRPGEAWSMTLRLRTPRGLVNPGGRDYQAWLLSEGIDATGYVVNKAPNARLTGTYCAAQADRWRMALRERLAAVVGHEPQFGKLLAITIGDDALFTARDWELFAATGTTHLMVISGMHITLVAMLSLAIALALLARCTRLLCYLPLRSAAVLLAYPAALLYGALAGWSVSVQRALLMLAVLFVYALIERHLRPWLGFALALLLVLLLQPMAALQTGFWLSFLAVAALILGFSGRLAPPTRGQLAWQPQLLIAVALAVPLLLAGQSQAPLGALVNLFAIPLVDLVVVPSALLGCVLLLLDETLALPVLRLALLALELLCSGLEFAARWSPPLHASPAGVAPWRIAAALLGTLWLLLPRGVPARAVGALLLLPVLLPARVQPAVLELLLLDVGQGTAAIVRTREHTLVYDTGPRFSERFDAGSGIVAPALRSIGIAEVDTLLLSHADGDHAGGMSGLLEKMPVREILGGEILPGIDMRVCERGMRWHWDGVEFSILHPPSGARMRQANDRSCVLRIVAGSRSVLLAGDIEALAEAALLYRDHPQLRSDVLLVPHHGSRTSSSAAFVAATAARYALVSAGYRNRFGHPHPLVAQRYRESGALLLNTATEGALLVRVDAQGELEVLPGWRRQQRRFWFRE